MPARRDTKRYGFTLVEMAMVMVIMGMVMLALFPALTAVRVANQKQVTQSNLRSLMLATAAYVQANGCLPCPSNPSLAGTSLGRMGYSSTTTVCGTCAKPEGLPPYVALGLPASTAHDGGGHWITMRVDPALTVALGGAPPAATCTATDATNGLCLSTQANSAAKWMCKTGLATTGRISVTTPQGATQQEAVIFVSHGVNGYGSYFAQINPTSSNGNSIPFPSGYTSCGNGGYAECNGAATSATTNQFYDAPPVVSDAAPYDDILAYADRNTLVSMFGNGSCQTVW